MRINDKITNTYMRYFQNLRGEKQLDVFDRSVIFEDIIQVDILDLIFEYVFDQLKGDSQGVVELSCRDIYSLLPLNFKHRKYFKENTKRLFVCRLEFNNFNFCKKVLVKVNPNITDEEVQELGSGEKHIDVLGFFTNSYKFLKDINSGLLVLNSKLPKNKLFEVFCHEFHHFYQWASGGRSLSNLDSSKFDQLDPDVVDEVREIYPIQDFSSFYNKHELTAYSNTIFTSVVSKFRDLDLGFNRDDIHDFFDLLFNLIEKFRKSSNSFADFDEQLRRAIESWQGAYEEYPFLEFRDSSEFSYLIVAAYLKIGYNTLKNHLYSYVNTY